MSEFVVVDASVAFKWLVEEENTDKATALIRLWNEKGTQLAAPRLMPLRSVQCSTPTGCRGNLQWRLRQASCRT